MLNTAQISAYHQHGFLRVEQLLTLAEITQLRQDAIEVFQAPALTRDTIYKRSNLYKRNAAFKWLLYYPPVVAILKVLVGDDYYTAEESFAAHHAFYSDWHTDTAYYDLSKQRFHLEPDFFMLNVAFYLQNNDPQYGGGLEVIPGSHHQPVANPQTNPHILARRYAIPHQAGDLVLFDHKLMHRATQPVVPVEQIPPNKQKLALFWSISRNNRHIDAYYQLMQQGYPLRRS